MARVMALLAMQSGMAPDQRIAGLAVVEFVLGGGPADDVEVLAVVFGMATRAIDVSLGPVDHPSVITSLAGNQQAYLPMAVQTA